MIRSRLPLVRFILVPYLVLLLLFVFVTGVGSVWLYFKSRQAQSQLLIHGLLTTVSPLIEHIPRTDIPDQGTDSSSWLHRELESIFRRLPGLEIVCVRTPQSGFRKHHTRQNTLVTENLSAPSPPDGRDMRTSTAASRLYSESEPLLRVEFLVNSQNGKPVRLEFGFDRATLRGAVSRAMAIMVQAIIFFWAICIICLLVAFVVTVWAATRVRGLEAHVQELYRHASAAELMAGLVHDLRNPLASFRANLAALRITPEESDEILTEMDQDLVRLDAKLGSMLDLTRKRDEPLQEVDVERLLATVARLAEPKLVRQGLELQYRSRLDRPALLMADAMRDALLNLVHNSAESGQQDGVVELECRQEEGRLIFQVRDRGNGLPKNTKIFQPFVTTKPTGHGLGLAITRRTVEAHGGTILAANREGGGTVITISLPQRPAGEAE